MVLFLFVPRVLIGDALPLLPLLLPVTAFVTVLPSIALPAAAALTLPLVGLSALLCLAQP
jgi:hypothetical protein